jgi:hypothetical protein
MIHAYTIQCAQNHTVAMVLADAAKASPDLVINIISKITPVLKARINWTCTECGTGPAAVQHIPTPAKTWTDTPLNEDAPDDFDHENTAVVVVGRDNQGKASFCALSLHKIGDITKQSSN